VNNVKALFDFDLRLFGIHLERGVIRREHFEKHHLVEQHFVDDTQMERTNALENGGKTLVDAILKPNF